MPMKFKLFAILFALVFSAGIISHETSHFELDHGEHVHNEHAVDLSEDCSTCLTEQIEYVQDDTVLIQQPFPLISLMLIRQVKSPSLIINFLFAHHQEIKF